MSVWKVGCVALAEKLLEPLRRTSEHEDRLESTGRRVSLYVLFAVRVGLCSFTNTVFHYEIS